MINISISLSKAMEVTIMGSAANMLPLPGSTMVRVAALKLSGAGIKHSTLTTLIVAIVWVSISFLYAGLMLSTFHYDGLGEILSIIGLISLLVTSITVFSTQIKTVEYLKLIIIKLSLVSVDAVRIYWCFQVFDIELMFSQASAFVISSVLGSAVSIVPAGLGVREVVSAGIAPLVGLAPSAGFLTATLNRVIGLSALLPLAGVLIYLERKRKRKV